MTDIEAQANHEEHEEHEDEADAEVAAIFKKANHPVTLKV